MEIISPNGKNKKEEQRKKSFLLRLPKTELHVHLEGTLEPATVLEFARRNQTKFPFKNVEQIQLRLGAAHDLPTFIEIYEKLLSVLHTEDDFYDAAMRYFRRAQQQGVVYVEMFFDPQMHTTRGIAFSTVANALLRAQRDAANTLGMRCVFILCFNRDRSLESAQEHLAHAIPYSRDFIAGVGTDNPEHRDFPLDLAPAFARAAEEGFRLTSHCDVDFEASVQNIRGCLDLLRAERIDHGVNVLDDPELAAHARTRRAGFTVCPTHLYGETLGEMKSGYFERCARAAKAMLDARLRVTLASDDPGMMCSRYVGDIYNDVRELLDLSLEDMVAFARNGFEMAWISDEDKQQYFAKINDFVKQEAI